MKLLTDAGLGTFEGLGSLGKDTASWTKGGNEAFILFTTTFSTGIGVLTVAAGIWFIIQFFSGSFQWLASGGEKQALQNAQKRIVNAVLGLFVVIFAFALISIISLIFGVDILSPYKALMGIWPGVDPGPGPCLNPPCSIWQTQTNLQ